MEGRPVNLDGDNQVQLNRQELRRAERYDVTSQAVRTTMADVGNQMLYGNLVPELGQKTDEGIHDPIDFYDNQVRERIQSRVRQNIEMNLSTDISYEQITKVFIQDRQREQDEQGREHQMRRLQELVHAYPKTSFRKRKKYFEKAEATFVRIDKLLDKLEAEQNQQNEQDQQNQQSLIKQFKIKLEIIRLKADALIARAKAYQESPMVTGDEIANIEIAALYEAKALFEGFDNLEGDALHELRQQYSEEAIEAKVELVAQKRHTKSRLELFNEAAEKREAEYNHVEGTEGLSKEEADAEFDSNMAVTCNRELNRINLTENDAALDQFTEQSFKKSTDPSVEGALVIRKHLGDFVDEVVRNVVRMDNGKPVLEYARTTMDKQYTNLVALCREYLTVNENKATSNNNEEKTSYEYVKKLMDKLTDKVKGKGRVSFAARFSVIYDSFIEHRKHRWTDFSDKENEAAIQQNNLEKLQEAHKGGSSLTLKSAKVLRSREMNIALGEGEEVSMDTLKTQIDGISTINGRNAVPLNELKYEIPQGDAWAEDRNLLAIDAVLRSCGIFLEGGPRALLKAIPKSIRNEIDVMEHFDKLLYKHNALVECKPLIEKLLGEAYTIKHEEFVVPPVVDDAILEHDEFQDDLFEKIQEAVQEGAAVMLYDSATRDCVTITGCAFNEATQEASVRVISSKQNATGSARNMLFTELMKKKIATNKKFTIEYLKRNH